MTSFIPFLYCKCSTYFFKKELLIYLRERMQAGEWEGIEEKEQADSPWSKPDAGLYPGP